MNTYEFSVTAGSGSDSGGTISFNADKGKSYRIHSICYPKKRGHKIIIEELVSKKSKAEIFVYYNQHQNRTKLYTPQGVIYY